MTRRLPVDQDLELLHSFHLQIDNSMQALSNLPTNVTQECYSRNTKIRDIIEDDPEDIMSASLQTLFDHIPVFHSAPGSIFTYTIKRNGGGSALRQITLQIPDTQASNWSLHASSIWQSSIHIADHIENLQLDRFSDRKILRVLELGAGAGLPSIMIARTTPNAAVVVSDYPDEKLICTLSDNVRNHTSERCWTVPYAWGNDISPLLTPAQQNPECSALFDIIVAADTLWNPETHVQFTNTLCMCLNRSPDARVHLVAGLHTGRYTLQSFMDAVIMHKLQVESVAEREVMDDGVQRPWDVTRAESEDEKERRKWVVWMVLKWAS